MLLRKPGGRESPRRTAPWENAAVFRQRWVGSVRVWRVRALEGGTEDFECLMFRRAPDVVEGLPCLKRKGAHIAAEIEETD